MVAANGPHPEPVSLSAGRREPRSRRGGSGGGVRVSHHVTGFVTQPTMLCGNHCDFHRWCAKCEGIGTHSAVLCWQSQLTRRATELSSTSWESS